MSSGRNATDDDDDLAKLMPNVAKLIRSGESSSLESKGSTSMSFSGNTVKHKIERQNPKPSRQRQGESVFREVANKFLRRGATAKRASKSPVLATLSSNCRIGSPSSERWRNTNALEKENVRPKMTTLAKQGARLARQQKMVMRDASQKVARKFRKLPPCSEGSNYFSVNSKIQRADKSNTASGSEHLAQSDAPVTVPKASCNSQGSEHVSNLARKSERGKTKLLRTTMPLNLSELIEEFAEIDGEALEEEEMSIAPMPRIAPVVASETLLDHGHGILENSVEIQKDLSRNEPEKVVSNTAKASIEEAVHPINSHGHRKERVGICISQSMLSKPPGHDQDVPVSEPAGKGNDAVMSSGHDPNAIPCPMRHLNAPFDHNLDDGNQGDNDQCRDDDNPPCIEQDASPFIKGLKNQVSVDANGRTADTKPTSCHLEVCALDTSGKGASICAEFEMPYAEGSCNPKIGNFLANPGDDWLLSIGQRGSLPAGWHSLSAVKHESWSYFLDLLMIAGIQHFGQRCRADQTVTVSVRRQFTTLAVVSRSSPRVILFSGCSPTQPNLDKSKAAVEGDPDENAAHREGSVPHLSSTFRDVQSSLPKAKNPSEQENVVDIPLQGGNFSTGDTSRTPLRLHYRRRWRTIGMNQRRLAFESDNESNQKAVVRSVDSDSGGVSVSTVEFKGRTNSAAGIINHDGHDFDANMTSVPIQEAQLALPDGEVIGEGLQRPALKRAGCITHRRLNWLEDTGDVDREKLLTSSLAQEGHLPAFEGTGEMGKDPYCFSCLSPKTGGPTECLKIRGVGKRTWANLGAPIDGGREWKEGRRVSTRIKSRPLDWWRGERMLYGRVHSTLCTLIGIKTTSPDPVWPRPKPKRGDYTSSNFHVDSFVDGSHCELLRLAAQ